ncbi:LETM1-related biofilm-associated protein [Flavobacterium sp. RHBU_24]|uniref:LETM1-related biofilm-associated protein n=1 Tax=Flavobacterium sp. RHBU_24 TaxID=3391185 RepID=UPI003984665D
MINPSASGWIDKFFGKLKGRLPVYENSHDLYRAIRDSGFIYGHVVILENIDDSEVKQWDTHELTKVALMSILFDVYRLITKESDTDDFIKRAIPFYKQMQPESFALLKKVLPSSPQSHELENLLDVRIRTNDNIISRSFSHILTNALLFMDVLAFRQYLLDLEKPQKYIKKLEEAVVTIVTLALNSKEEKTQYDDLLIRLFEASVRYTKLSAVSTGSLENAGFDYFESKSEKNYLLDMAAMAIWSDGRAHQSEIDFMYRLNERLGLRDDAPAESIASYDVFIKLNRKHIPFFNYSNPVKHFYDHAAQSVSQLIIRNKNRLVKELSNNGELVVLLTHSTHRSLNAKEKKKIKKQLLEICKTVPSLTIFLLPGGSLLLPLLIKFIPQLLPSVLNENLDKEDNG